MSTLMQFSCEKALLQSAINTASRAVAAKSSIPALEGILMEAGNGLTVSGYDMHTGIRTKLEAEVSTPGSLVLNAHLLGEIVRRLPDDMVTLSANDKYVVSVSCGDASYEVPGLSAEDFPELPEVDQQNSISISQSMLRTMLSETSFSVSTNEIRPIHTGVRFEIDDTGLTLVAVDGYRLALRHEKLEHMSGEFAFVAPGSALGEVEKICADIDEFATITLGQRHILFEVGSTELICRRLEGDFLDYRNAIPRKNPISVVVNTKDLINSIDRVSVVISEKLKSPVRFQFKDGTVSLNAHTARGEASDVCPIEGDGQNLEIGFNSRYLMEALRHTPAEKVKVELNTGISPCVMVPTEGEENFLYMVLPVRLKAQ